MDQRPTTYRPEIEGLRAIAVMAVVIFHVDILANGFVGDDSFFVISGYLIGGQLYREFLASGRVGLLRFAVRRFRRLMPNGMLVLLLTLGFGLFLLPEPDWETLTLDTATSAINIVNFVLADRSLGYFSPLSTTNLLLHFRSLSVEEQFYLGFPLLL